MLHHEAIQDGLASQLQQLHFGGENAETPADLDFSERWAIPV